MRESAHRGGRKAVPGVDGRILLGTLTLQTSPVDCPFFHISPRILRMCHLPEPHRVPRYPNLGTRLVRWSNCQPALSAQFEPSTGHFHLYLGFAQEIPCISRNVRLKGGNLVWLEGKVGGAMASLAMPAGELARAGVSVRTRSSCRRPRRGRSGVGTTLRAAWSTVVCKKNGVPLAGRRTP